MQDFSRTPPKHASDSECASRNRVAEQRVAEDSWSRADQNEQLRRKALR
jgi:hypothetical protein